MKPTSNGVHNKNCSLEENLCFIPILDQNIFHPHGECCLSMMKYSFHCDVQFKTTGEEEKNSFISDIF